ncbi:hypothetical protein SNE40_014464 [Patella caerulea]|uniref:Uncharacterized protein n=1 Tax=Patella caerulea TaxID=87958 RepID=A0AAN8JI95_PATCE
MNVLTEINGNTLAIISMVILVMLDVVYSQCPHDAIEQMQACTGRLGNMTVGKDLQKVERFCKNLMEVSICLETIFNKCQEHLDAQHADSLKQTTYQWKDKLDKICRNISANGATISNKNFELVFVILIFIKIILWIDRT